MAENASPSDNWSKWYIAIALGIPVVGLGSWWYWRRLKERERTTKQPVFESPTEKSVDGSQDSSPTEVSIEKALLYKGSGNKHFRSNSYSDAIECYTNAIAVCPPDKHEELATFYQNRAAAYEQLKQYPKVVEDCSSALEWNKQYLKALFRRAKAYEILGRPEDMQLCLEDITAVCILEQFSNQNSLLMADRVLKEVGKTKAKEIFVHRVPKNPSPHFVKTFLQSFAHDPIIKDAQDAEDCVEKEDRFPGQVDNLTKKFKTSYYVAAIALKHLKFDEIINLTTAELDQTFSKKQAEAFLLRGTMFMLRGEADKAIQDLTAVIELGKAAPRKVRSNALVKRGNLQMQAGMQAEALGDYALAADIDAANSDVYHHRGQLYLLMDKIEEAVRDFERSVDLNPRFAVANIQKCYTEYRAALIRGPESLLREKLEDFRKTVERFDDCSEGYALYGQAMADQHLYSEADEYFSKAANMDPASGNILVHRGLLRLQWKSDITSAVEFIEKALQVDPFCEFAYETLGTIEVQRGNLKKAVTLFNRAIGLAKTEVEMVHLCSLLQAAKAQSLVAHKFGIQNPNLLPATSDQ